TATAQLQQARGALQAATAQREQAVAAYAQVKQGARPEQIDAAAVAYQQAAAAVQQAQAAYDKIRGDPDLAMRPQALALQQTTLAAESAKANYQGLLAGATTPQLTQASAAVDQAVAGIIQAAATISQTEAAVTTANANLAAEQARLGLLKAGSASGQIKTGEANLAAAQAQARAAAGQVAAGRAALAAVDVQIAQLRLTAPADGVVLTRSIEPGEMALPGNPLLVFGDLGRPTLTVYLPEDQYGVLHVGDRARVTADSFRGREFAGVVRHIADQAEFTPRNVQTAAGRRTTVFAVRLDIANPGLELKPGMPADVIFEPGTPAAAAAAPGRN
ncbi:MAG TPA: efflux RND transporter periplasmic adaptor subunit, partial [Anaerolineae bacterium]